MVSYRLAPEAKADLERIWFYGLENWGLEAADKYYAAFFTILNSLQSNLICTLQLIFVKATGAACVAPKA
ncbi:type II toxin-antitoxin system RelE/ParE family toxin [Haliea sp. E1-2-M8]|uniref:type II toxin-antitoxin system RelE/ParE family toxin n=1 Tax=Haliea sp. E1-2-M8 TaxID=3064706 RepID=UPI00351BEE59